MPHLKNNYIADDTKSEFAEKALGTFKRIFAYESNVNTLKLCLMVFNQLIWSEQLCQKYEQFIPDLVSLFSTSSTVVYGQILKALYQFVRKSASAKNTMKANLIFPLVEIIEITPLTAYPIIILALKVLVELSGDAETRKKILEFGQSDFFDHLSILMSANSEILVSTCGQLLCLVKILSILFSFEFGFQFYPIKWPFLKSSLSLSLK